MEFIMKKIAALFLCLIITLPLLFSCGKDPKPGNKIGTLCYDYTLYKIASEGTDNILSHRGDNVIIHFFGTWCEDGEIETLDRLQNEDRDLTVFAIHTSHQKENAKEFIENNYSESSIVFLYDYPVSKQEDKYYSMLGGTDTYPYTLVLDKDGVIRAIKTGSFTYSEMKDMID